MMHFLSVNICLIVILIVQFVEADYYELLGITKEADSREIRKAFKKLALVLHPDKNQDDAKAHDKFLEINQAYEVLKDPEKRKHYDTYGESPEETAQSRRGYHSWSYYSESFGIYDDDKEIVTLSSNDFRRQVHNSDDIWFVNFYSPQCSHCHELAPEWRKLARSFEGIIRIGAVNCEDDWSICREEGIRSYPSLILYPDHIKFQGRRDIEDLTDFLLTKLPDYEGPFVAPLTSKSAVVVACMNDDCLSKIEIKKLALALQHLAPVSCCKSKSQCKLLNIERSGNFYFADADSSPLELEGSDAVEIRRSLLKALPDLTIINENKLKAIFKTLKQANNEEHEPWFLLLNRGKSDINEEIKQIRGLVHSVNLGAIDCDKYPSACEKFAFAKTPAFVVLKTGGSYELYHGETATPNELSLFIRESATARLETGTPESVAKLPKPVLIDYFAPWCPPCMQTLPELRKASTRAPKNVRFATIDCSRFQEFCRNSNLVKSYPSLVFHNATGDPQVLVGRKTAEEILDFIEDVLNPRVVSLTPETFASLVEGKKKQQIWAVDFFAPWCGPCQKVAPQWNAFARLIQDEPSIRVGKVDCQAHSAFCQRLGVTSYPSLRIYPRGKFDSENFKKYGGWSRDANSFSEWARQFLPGGVLDLEPQSFAETVLKDRKPWVVDFFAPWCGHCVQFRPTFNRVAKSLHKAVRFASIDCDLHQGFCSQLGIRGYPTVMFYRGSQDGRLQDWEGVRLRDLSDNFFEDEVMKHVGSRQDRAKDEL